MSANVGEKIRERIKSAIRDSQSAFDTKIIALTANALSDDRERCEAAGMDGYLAKPVALDSLLRTIAATLALPLAAE